jgi:membrane protein YqaA with SNARE-associated domain
MSERLSFPHRQWEAGTWRRMVQVASMVALTAALLVALVPGTTSLVVFVLLTVWCHGPLSPLLPAAYEPVLLGYGRLFPPLLLAITGAVASTAIEYVNYHLYQKLLKVECVDRILVSPPTRRLMGPFFRRPFLTVWLCVLTPLPDWAARILASHSGYSVRSYLTAVLLARLPRFWLLAALGFHLKLGSGVVLSVVAASAVLALIGLWRRQPTPASAKTAMPISVLLLLGVMSAPLPLGRLEGQDPPPRVADQAMGLSMDRFMYEGSGVVAVSYRSSRLRPGSIGPELGVSLFPQTLSLGVLALAPDLGAAYNFPVPGGSLLIKGGGSAITALGTAGILFVPGFHVGGTIIVQTGRRSGLRIDVIRHYYLPGGEELWPIWSVGLGFAILPRVRS